MKDYYIKEVDGHHIVVMLSEEQIDLIQSLAETLKLAFERIQEVFINAAEGFRAMMNSIDLEKLKELDHHKYSTQQNRHHLPVNATRPPGLIYARYPRD